MPAKGNNKGSKIQTLAEALACVSDTDFESAIVIAARAGKSLRGTEQKLYRMYDKGLVEKSSHPLPYGGARNFWRRLPEGAIAPLYDPPPGVDMRVLDACLARDGTHCSVLTRRVYCSTYLRT